MDYLGPDAGDLDDVRALNLEFLSGLGNRAARERLVPPDASRIGERLAALSADERRRLAGAPFLLMSFREDDEACWDAILEPSPATGLFVTGDGPGYLIARLVAGGLGFVWQLSKRNGYAARIVTGAPPGWCERISGTTLMELVTRAVGYGDLLCLRTAGDAGFWKKLIDGGTRAEPELCVAARLSAMQAMLTQSRASRYRRMRTAACAITAPPAEVADKEKQKHRL